MTSIARTSPVQTSRPLGVAAMRALYRSRRALAALDDAALRDIGLSPSEARQEAGHMFWDMPQGWLRTRSC